MKLTIETSADIREPEVILRCPKEYAYTEELRRYLEGFRRQLSVRRDGAVYRVDIKDIYYFEAVDKKIFACTQQEVYEVPATLERLEETLRTAGFLRCSKSMILNLKKVESFCSHMGGRLCAVLENGERAIINRHYAAGIRSYLEEVGER